MSASAARGGSSSLCDLARVVLAVAVDLHRALVAVVERVPEAGVHGAADAEVERQVDDRTPARSATSAVPSVEPSSTTTTSSSGIAAQLVEHRRASLLR